LKNGQQRYLTYVNHPTTAALKYSEALNNNKKVFRAVIFYTFDDKVDRNGIEKYELKPEIFEKLISTKEFVRKSEPPQSTSSLVSFFDGKCDISINCQRECVDTTDLCPCTTTTPFTTTPSTPEPTTPVTPEPTTPVTPEPTTPTTPEPTTTKPITRSKTYIPPPGSRPPRPSRIPESYPRPTGIYSIRISWPTGIWIPSRRTRTPSRGTTTTTGIYQEVTHKDSLNPIKKSE